MRTIFIVILLGISIVSGFSQNSKLLESVKGFWTTDIKGDISYDDWKATWIWMDDKLSSDVMLARRMVELAELPEIATLRITASSQYELYINGTYVNKGPARSAPHHQSYDILEVGDLLQIGQNSIAVRVHALKNKYSYHDKQKGGLLAQLNLELGTKEKVIATDNSWKVSHDPSWDSEAPVISRFQMVVNDRVDFREYLRDWNSIDFNDTTWANATQLMRTVGWPNPQRNARPQVLTPPWLSLVPRDVPYLLEIEKNDFIIIEARQVSLSKKEHEGLINNKIKRDFEVDPIIANSFKGFMDGVKDLRVPASYEQQAWYVLLDFGKMVTGSPMLELEGVSGTEVEIVTAPFIVDDVFDYKLLDSEFRDKIILSGKKDSWTAMYFKPTRYMALVIKNQKAPVHISSIGLRQIKYPFENRGYIKSKDVPWVKEYMDATEKTLIACTTDAFTDNYRERRQYAQTGYYAALGNNWTFSDHYLQRRYLIQIAQEQEPNGIMPAYAPLGKDDYMVILDSNCLYIRSLRNYLLYSGDSVTVRELLPAAKKLMTILDSYTNDYGMINNPPFPYWLDHALLDRRGSNMTLNGHYLGALRDFAEILNWLDAEGADEYRKRGLLLEESLRTHLWDRERGLFADAWIDGETSNQFSEHANAMALALNIATQNQAKKITKQLLDVNPDNKIKREDGLVVVTPAMSYFLHKGLCEYGYVDESFKLFRDRFDSMLDSTGNGTLYEEWWLSKSGRTGKSVEKSRSDAQTESCFPPALFAEYLLGIIPTKIGLAEVDLFRTTSDLKNIEGKVPTPNGDLLVNWNFDDMGGGVLGLEIPSNMKVNVHLKSLLKGKTKLTVDNRIVSSTLDQEYLVLKEGNHQVKF